jgi:hypothetical protein
MRCAEEPYCVLVYCFVAQKFMARLPLEDSSFNVSREETDLSLQKQAICFEDTVALFFCAVAKNKSAESPLR